MTDISSLMCSFIFRQSNKVTVDGWYIDIWQYYHYTSTARIISSWEFQKEAIKFGTAPDTVTIIKVWKYEFTLLNTGIGGKNGLICLFCELCLHRLSNIGFAQQLI